MYSVKWKLNNGVLKGILQKIVSSATVSAENKFSDEMFERVTVNS